MDQHHRYRERIYPTYTTLHAPEATSATWVPAKKTIVAILTRLKPWLPEPKEAACLDVACGTGTLMLSLREAGYSNVHGVDYSEQQVHTATQILSNVVHGDAIDFLHKQPERFDLITAIDIIEHFDKNEVFEFVDALFVALKPGGRLIVQTPNASSPWFGSVRYGDFTHELAFTPESLSRVLTVAGFSDFDARECYPFAHGIKSGARFLLWKLLRAFALSWNLVETGSSGSGIVTRVFIAKADKSQ